MPTPTTEQIRAKQFKNSGKHEEMRRRRAEGSVELRKQKKDEQLMKRRNIDLADVEGQGDGSTSEQLSPSLQDFSAEACFAVLSGPDTTPEYAEAVKSLRKLLSRNNNPPLDIIIRAGLVPCLLKALSSQKAEIQFEAAWALTNIVSGTSEQTAVVVDSGAVLPLVVLLSSPSLQVAEQAAWALGNIAGESAHYRDLVIEAGAVNAMVALGQRPGISIDLLRTLAWTFSNFCRHKRPHVETKKIEPLIQVLCWMLRQEDKQMKTDACWALSYFTDGPDDRISVALNAGILQHVINLLTADDRKLAAPALRTLGNIVTGTDEQTQAVVDTGVLKTHIPYIVTTTNPGLSRECCWMMSNVLAGTPTQIQSVIDAGLIAPLIDRLEKGDFRTQTEAAWAITNMVTGGLREQVLYVLSLNVLPPFCKLLNCKDSKTILVVLDGMRLMLDLADQMDKLNELCLTLEECGGVDYIENLQSHENEDIYHKAVHIIEKYFGTESDEGEDDKENSRPAAERKLFQTPVADTPNEGFQF